MALQHKGGSKVTEAGISRIFQLYNDTNSFSAHIFCTVLFELFCTLTAMCLTPLYFISFFTFLQCPHLYICIVCMYIWLNCIYLYLNVYCQCLMLTVCTKGLRVTQFQFSVCMYCTCGRIDNKADLTSSIKP